MRLMSVRPIVHGDVPVLREICESVREFGMDLNLLLTDLLDTLEAHRGLGLAAPQIGVPVRAVVMNTSSGPVAFVNPEIVERTGDVSGYESCLSFPDIVLEVRRPERIRLVAQDVVGTPIEVIANGLDARILCHEVDHLNGVLFMDHLPDEDLFEQLMTLNLVHVSESDDSNTAPETLKGGSGESDLRLAADLFADAAWKAVLAQQILDETGMASGHAEVLHQAIQALERVGSSLEETFESSE
ncbi:peptide deformylase [Alicyclobacillus sp. ALC3]|uniref:peptide deformylase n=1 Tax=Alicyclobacillus sp. ALC3 TaxID=2796143 RepID=UPI0023789229|nr:peptide deformylase [Alicyclobacillus sp. ALC3]WDL96358.1 peptide deformylase [Alicyclobacillus sp. ALC3]